MLNSCYFPVCFSLSLFASKVAKRVEGRLAEEAKAEQRRAFEALEDGEEQAPPPKLKKISTTQVAINYVRWVGHTRERGIVPGEMRFVLLLPTGK